VELELVLLLPNPPKEMHQIEKKQTNKKHDMSLVLDSSFLRFKDLLVQIIKLSITG
jgi:hypothetical protein